MGEPMKRYLVIKNCSQCPHLIRLIKNDVWVKGCGNDKDYQKTLKLSDDLIVDIDSTIPSFCKLPEFKERNKIGK